MLENSTPGFTQPGPRRARSAKGLPDLRGLRIALPARGISPHVDLWMYPDHQVAVVLYSPAMRREKVDLGRKFMTAYLRAVRDYNDAFGKKQAQKKREVIAIFAKHTPVKDPSLYEKMVMPWLDPNGAVIRQSLRFDQDWYAQNGFVPRTVNLSLVVDDRFVLQAVEQLGRYR